MSCECHKCQKLTWMWRHDGNLNMSFFLKCTLHQGFTKFGLCHKKSNYFCLKCLVMIGSSAEEYKHRDMTQTSICLFAQLALSVFELQVLSLWILSVLALRSRVLSLEQSEPLSAQRQKTGWDGSVASRPHNIQTFHLCIYLFFYFPWF